MAPDQNGRIDRLRWLRTRAAEVRTAVEGTTQAQTRMTLLHIAQTYEKMADHLEHEDDTRVCTTD
jgi:hypothetical protein